MEEVNLYDDLALSGSEDEACDADQESRPKQEVSKIDLMDEGLLGSRSSVQTQIVRVDVQAEKFKIEIEALKKENTVLERNLVLLYKTAHHLIQMKDKELSKLKAKYDAMCFRKNKPNQEIQDGLPSLRCTAERRVAVRDRPVMAAEHAMLEKYLPKSVKVGGRDNNTDPAPRHNFDRLERISPGRRKHAPPAERQSGRTSVDRGQMSSQRPQRRHIDDSRSKDPARMNGVRTSRSSRDRSSPVVDEREDRELRRLRGGDRISERHRARSGSAHSRRGREDRSVRDDHRISRSERDSEDGHAVLISDRRSKRGEPASSTTHRSQRSGADKRRDSRRTPEVERKRRGTTEMSGQDSRKRKRSNDTANDSRGEKRERRSDDAVFLDAGHPGLSTERVNISPKAELRRSPRKAVRSRAAPEVSLLEEGEISQRSDEIPVEDVKKRLNAPYDSSFVSPPRSREPTDISAMSVVDTLAGLRRSPRKHLKNLEKPLDLIGSPATPNLAGKGSRIILPGSTPTKIPVRDCAGHDPRHRPNKRRERIMKLSWDMDQAETEASGIEESGRDDLQKSCVNRFSVKQRKSLGEDVVPKTPDLSPVCGSLNGSLATLETPPDNRRLDLWHDQEQSDRIPITPGKNLVQTPLAAPGRSLRSDVTRSLVNYHTPL